MSSKRPDGRVAFLGTEEIVRRLRAAQPARLGALPRRAGQFALLLVLVAGTTYGAGALGLGARVRALTAPKATTGSAVDHPQDGPSVVSLAPTPPQAPPNTRVLVRASGGNGACVLLLDGNILANGCRWEGDVPRGRHVFAVRTRAGEQSQAVQLQGGRQELSFAVGSHRGQGRRHRADGGKAK